MQPVRNADNLTTILGHCHVIWNLNFLEPSGHLGPVMGLTYLLPITSMEQVCTDVSYLFNHSVHSDVTLYLTPAKYEVRLTQ